MANTPGIIFFEAITPVHMGAGSSLSHIDLPIQRNQVTGLPIFQSSGVKGALRAWTRETCQGDSDKEKLIQIFGPEPGGDDNQDDRAGLLGITDAELLLFPVASEPGVFSFVTCPMILNEFIRKINAAGLILNAGQDAFEDLPEIQENKALISSRFNQQKSRLWLLDLPFETDRTYVSKLDKLASLFSDLFFSPDDPMRTKISKNIILIDDDVFSDLTAQATEVRNRIKIDYETGTVQQGALWTEELLPIHSIMYSLSFFNSRNNGLTPDEIYDFFSTLNLHVCVNQMGGDQTLGHGLVKTAWHIRTLN